MTDLITGIELDALIAEKVFGLQRRVIAKHTITERTLGSISSLEHPYPHPVEDIIVFDHTPGYGHWFLSPPGLGVHEVYVSDGYGDPIRPLPVFSKDIAAAWEVVERMSAQGFWVQITAQAAGVLAEPIECSIGLKGRDLPSTEVDSDSMPHAICLAALAALKAVGHE